MLSVQSVNAPWYEKKTSLHDPGAEYMNPLFRRSMYPRERLSKVKLRFGYEIFDFPYFCHDAVYQISKAYDIENC